MKMRGKDVEVRGLGNRSYVVFSETGEPVLKHYWYEKIQVWFILQMSKIHWRQRKALSEDQIADLKSRFAVDYYIIASRRKNYLTTFFIGLGNFLLTGKWGFYSHVFMNLEDEVKDDGDFRFIEATGAGVHYSTFDEVIGPIDAIALIKPKNMTLTEWTEALDSAKTYLGRPYDNLFDLKTDLEINCVELIRLALQGIPGYETKFAEFEKMVAKKKKLTPDMFLQCSDFEVVYKAKR